MEHSKRATLRYNLLLNLLKFYVRSTITHILSDLKRMRTITRTIGTFRPSVQLEGKNGLGPRLALTYI